MIDIYITIISTPLKVRIIGTSKYINLKYVIIPIYLQGVDDKNNSLILVYFRKELYLVDSLKSKILIGKNITSPKDIVINLV